jgi:hypothetical protein
VGRLLVCLSLTALALVFAASAHAGDPLLSSPKQTTTTTVTSTVSKTTQKTTAPITKTTQKAAPVTNTADKATAPAKQAPQKGTVAKTTQKAAAPVTRITEKAASGTRATSAITNRVSRTTTKTVERVAKTTAPVVKTVEKTTAPVVATAKKTTQSVANTAKKTTAPVVEAIGKTTAPVVETIGKTTAPVVETIRRTTVPIAGAPEPIATSRVQPTTTSSKGTATDRATVADRPATLNAATRPAPRVHGDGRPNRTMQGSADAAAPEFPSSQAVGLFLENYSAVDAGPAVGSGTARPRWLDTNRVPSAPSGGGASGSASAVGFFFGLFAALLAAFSVAAPRLSRWLRLTPDLRRPPLFISLLERPG